MGCETNDSSSCRTGIRSLLHTASGSLCILKRKTKRIVKLAFLKAENFARAI